MIVCWLSKPYGHCYESVSYMSQKALPSITSRAVVAFSVTTASAKRCSTPTADTTASIVSTTVF